MKCRLKSGVAASLNYVNLTNAQNAKSPKLIPYPNWETSFVKIDSKSTTNQTQPTAATTPLATSTVSPAGPPTPPTTPPPPPPPPPPPFWPARDTIISAFQVRVDRCNRLWVLDSGTVDILTSNPQQIAPPAIVIFYLNSFGQTDRIDIDRNVLRTDSVFGNMVSVWMWIRRIIHSCIVYVFSLLFFAIINIGRRCIKFLWHAYGVCVYTRYDRLWCCCLFIRTKEILAS